MIKVHEKFKKSCCPRGTRRLYIREAASHMQGAAQTLLLCRAFFLPAALRLFLFLGFFYYIFLLHLRCNIGDMDRDLLNGNGLLSILVDVLALPLPILRFRLWFYRRNGSDISEQTGYPLAEIKTGLNEPPLPAPLAG